MIEIMKNQPYATLTQWPYRANQNINPAFCKAAVPRDGTVLPASPCRVDVAGTMMETSSAPDATQRPSTMPGSPTFNESK
jgi:hypothetical protein